MKIRGRNIKRRLAMSLNLRDKLSRAKHFRGRAVHSPFVYSLVREVFMRKGLMGFNHSAYDALLATGVSEKRAVELQNLYDFCAYTSFVIDSSPAAGVSMAVYTLEYDLQQLGQQIALAKESGTTVVVLLPYDSRSRAEFCKAEVSHHNSTSVDNKGYLLLFNGQLPKQHFKL